MQDNYRKPVTQCSMRSGEQGFRQARAPNDVRQGNWQGSAQILVKIGEEAVSRISLSAIVAHSIDLRAERLSRAIKQFYVATTW